MMIVERCFYLGTVPSGRHHCRGGCTVAMSAHPDALYDPLARFRTSMGSSSTEHPAASGVVGAGRSSRGASRSPDPESSGACAADDDSDEDGSHLLRLIDEATQATVRGDNAAEGRDAGTSFIVTASASQSSLAHSLFGGSGVPPASPPSFADTMAAAQRSTPATAAVTHPLSPPPFGMMGNSMHQASSSQTSTSYVPPPPPPPGGPMETMVVRNHRGVFLLQPVGKAAAPTHSTSHPTTPSYAPPQYGGAPTGSSPPVSPLPSYALPPPVPPMHIIGHSVGGGINGHTPSKQSNGQSPPSYPAPPPYRSPSAKGAP